ncbi:MAG: methylated-DNA--[protein]-cysteine S-methyltransferase [Gammaproteobacteria bacterium]|nr:methylated-DNA--[protein]-cysteine S-methyltransferase [Gammaproteobacteria bacterium]
MSDYDRIADAIAYIVDNVERQPSLDEVAARVGLSPYHFQRLFSRWAGVTPKRFLQALTLEHAKRLLRESATLLEVADTVGLSSGSRLYDHFVCLEAVTPGEYKSEGEGMVIEYGISDTPFGEALVALTPRGICRFTFVDGRGPDDDLDALARAWPQALVRENRARARDTVAAMFAREGPADRPLSLHVSGTNFQINVWRALLMIPPAAVTTYARVAAFIGRPGAARAVGQAVGANPVAFLIPCHRVIRQSGALGGYYWGEIRKHAIQAWESAGIYR